ncbi:hypothetical protein TNCV_1309031 [Trichonephila clavipes]|nr:hypothetical protein TNCV_1309031 [Trichonephila clavipes]
MLIIRPVGDGAENIIPLMPEDFHHQRFEKTTLIFSMQKRRKDISKDRNKELGSSSVQGVPSTDVAVPDLSSLQLKSYYETRVHQFQTLAIT